MCAYPSYNANHSFAISYKDHLKNQKKYTDWLDRRNQIIIPLRIILDK